MFALSSRTTSFAKCSRQVMRRAYECSNASSKLLDDRTRDRIQGYINADNVVVFMKGTQAQPACGFSMAVKRVLDVHQVNFKDYNVLEDDQLREGIKVFSDWPTIPQVYIKGTFIGGSDILIQLHKDGEITELFDKNNIPSKFSDVLPVKEENTS